MQGKEGREREGRGGIQAYLIFLFSLPELRRIGIMFFYD